MSDAYFVVEEYLWFNEYQQGNVNVAGLVFDDLIEETLELGREDVLTVFSEQIADSFEFSESFAPLHLPVCSETFNIYEFFGTPLRVRQSVVNLIMEPPLVAAKIAAVHLDILHGIDIYWEEVSSEVMLRTTYANAVPYYWEYMYESFDIDMTEPQPEPPIIIAVNLDVTDLVNMRHEIVQEYFFNSKCFEELFIWTDQSWCWAHAILEELSSVDAVQEIIGKVAYDTICGSEEVTPKVNVKHWLYDIIFAFDRSVAERFYLILADDTFTMTDGIIEMCGAPTRVEETLEFVDTPVYKYIVSGLATESLVFEDFGAFAHTLIVEEGLAMGDVELEKWVCHLLVESGCDLTEVIG